MIVKGLTALAKPLKTCLSQGKKQPVQTRQHPPRMLLRQLNTNLGVNHVSSRSRWVQRKSRCLPNRSR
jgi:hypothetical protein